MENRNYRGDQPNRDRPNRDRPRGQYRHPRGGGDGRGRHQRPLLTSATTASGLCLVAMMLANPTTTIEMQNALGGATMAFATSAGVSYFAQRARKNWVEKTSDFFFMAGLLLIFYVSLAKMGVLS